MYVRCTTSILSHLLLLAATITRTQCSEVEDTNNTINAYNDTSLSSQTPWPNPPFLIPNKDGPHAPQQGFLKFDIIGERAQPGQRWSFDALILLITLLPSNRPLTPSVAVVEREGNTGIDPFFFDMRLSAGPGAPQGSRPPQQSDLNLMLRTLAAQVGEHGLNELNLNLVDHPMHYRGGVQLLLTPTKNVPRDPIIFLMVAVRSFWVRRTRVMLEIFDYEAHFNEPDKLKTSLYLAQYQVLNLPTADPFSSIGTDGTGYRFFMEKTKPNAVEFDNELALAALSTIVVFQRNFRSTFRFKIWSYRGQQESMNIGRGFLVADRGNTGMPEGDSTETSASGRLQGVHLTNTTNTDASIANGADDGSEGAAGIASF